MAGEYKIFYYFAPDPNANQRNRPLLVISYDLASPDDPPGEDCTPLFTIDYESTKNKVIKTITITEVSHHSSSTVWLTCIQPEFYIGLINIKLTWTSSGGNSYSGNRKINPGVIVSGDTFNFYSQNVQAPRLSGMINTVSIPSTVQNIGASSERGKVLDIVAAVYNRLIGGLGPVWRSAGDPGLLYNGKTFQELTDSEVESLSREHLEEYWAQQVSEMLVGTPYAGPGPNYGTTNENIFGKMNNTTDPACSIIYACQHLCCMAGLTRGFTQTETLQIDAADAGNVKNWTTGASTAGDIVASAKYLEAETAIQDKYLRPGGMYAFSKPRHVAFLLRVFSNNTMQFLDTSGMLTDPANSRADTRILGNYDCGNANSVSASGRKYVHLGVLPEPLNLAEAIKRSRKARPLGLARMVVFRKGTADPQQRICYASPWLPMWENLSGGKRRCYYITHYLWSLRDYPYPDEYDVRWLINIPQNTFYQRVRDNATLTWPPGQHSQALTSTLPVADLGCLASETGTVAHLARFGTSADKKKTHRWWIRHGETNGTENGTRTPAFLNTLPTGGPGFLVLNDQERYPARIADFPVNKGGETSGQHPLPEYFEGLPEGIT
ncbi:MAG TPA: hypothetical protein VHO70_23380 [Chitinispirillaceae bacterium]|nr:hypothetical protein [Chitinispirillaceae bacterium]